MGVKIGIDLGTTYSVVSYVDDKGVITNIESMEGDKTTPSVVYFSPDGTFVVGSRAREVGAMDPENLVERVKNFMGDPNFQIIKNGNMYSPCAVSTLILKKLISDAEQALGDEEIDGAVITCPAYFGDAAREATRIAGENVTLANGNKLNVLKIMDEPTAAAIAYGNSQHDDMDKTVLIYDLGGGTFDCTVMKLSFHGKDKKYQVITTAGNHQLGGKDWDSILADYVREEFCSATGEDVGEMADDAESKAWFSENIEKVKKQLTNMPKTTLTPSYNGQKQRIEITREKFDELTAGKFNETILLINQMLEQKGMSMDEIDEIILVGGSTRMKQVEEGLTNNYHKPLISFDPDKAVSNGAALVASGMNVDSNFGDGAESAADVAAGVDGGVSLGGAMGFEGTDGTSNTVIELCTKSYCLRYYKGGEPAYVNLVLKDTPKPCKGSLTEVFTNGLPLSGGDGNVMMDSVNLCIRENESLEKDVKDDECRDLYEEMPIPFAPPLPASTIVDVELFVDMNGQLTLTLIDIATGKRYETHPVRKGGDSNSIGLDIAVAGPLA